MTEFQQVIELAVEWAFVALNALGTLFVLVAVVGAIREYLKIKRQKKFWLFVSIAFIALAIRGINNINYELFGSTIFWHEKTNITLMVAAVCWMFCYRPLVKKLDGKIRKSLKRKKKRERKKGKKEAKATASPA